MAGTWHQQAGRGWFVFIVTAGKQGKGAVPNCLKCKNYYITYDPRLPRGCRAYGFKSQVLPAQVVLSTSGLPCQFFAARPTP